MIKKNFKGGLNSLLGEQPEDRILTDLIELPKDLQDKPKRGRPKTQTKEITKSSQDGTKENETRATFIVKENLLEELKAIAYWDRVLIKDVLNTAIQEYVDEYKTKGEIKPIPKK